MSSALYINGITSILRSSSNEVQAFTQVFGGHNPFIEINKGIDGILAGTTTVKAATLAIGTLSTLAALTSPILGLTWLVTAGLATLSYDTFNVASNI